MADDGDITGDQTRARGPVDETGDYVQGADLAGMESGLAIPGAHNPETDRPYTQAEVLGARLTYLPSEIIGAMLVALRGLSDFKEVWDILDRSATEHGI